MQNRGAFSDLGHSAELRAGGIEQILYIFRSFPIIADIGKNYIFVGTIQEFSAGTVEILPRFYPFRPCCAVFTKPRRLGRRKRPYGGQEPRAGSFSMRTTWPKPLFS